MSGFRDTGIWGFRALGFSEVGLRGAPVGFMILSREEGWLYEEILGPEILETLS